MLKPICRAHFIFGKVNRIKYLSCTPPQNFQRVYAIAMDKSETEREYVVNMLSSEVGGGRGGIADMQLNVADGLSLG